LKKQARAAAAGGQARCHGWLEWRSHGLPSLVFVKPGNLFPTPHPPPPPPMIPQALIRVNRKGQALTPDLISDI